MRLSFSLRHVHEVCAALIHAGLVVCWIGLASSTQAQGFRDVSEAWGFPADGKAAFADYDGDGWIDVFTGQLYRNQQGQGFQRVEANAPGGGSGLWGDYDNDGHPDLFVYGGKGALFRNVGDGTFAQVPFPELPTINSRGAVWADLNADGFLDLYVGGYEAWQEAIYPDVVYFNQADDSGGRRFVEAWRSAAGESFSARGVTAADFDEDGATDIFVSNYRLQPNNLWQNDGSGRLTNVAEERGAHGIPGDEINYQNTVKYPVCGHTIGSAFGDLDDDGHIDLFVGNFSHPPAYQNRPQFLRNLGPAEGYKFADQSATAGLAWQESYASPALGDYDNDGDLDLYFTTVYPVGSGGIKNFPVLYRNEGDWKFVDVTQEQGLQQLDATYQAAWADVDNDGDLDLATAGKLFLNELGAAPPANAADNSTPPAGHWIELELQGDGVRVNRSAIGATVRIRLGEKTLTRCVEAGTGEGNQNSLRLHFGLGEHDAPIDLEIAWPGGGVQTVKSLNVDQRHEIPFAVD